jgi:hypothetical protein
VDRGGSNGRGGDRQNPVPAVEEKHWSYVKPVRPALPAVSNEGWCRNPIDRFILARLEQEGLRPAAEADKYTLVRRVFLDLVGLPPTIAQADAFVSDTRPDAYERLVEELLGRRTTASAGLGRGLTWPAMPIRTDTKKIGCGRCGRIAIG